MSASPIRIKTTFSTAWHLLSGSKWAVWSPILAVVAISVALKLCLTPLLKFYPLYTAPLFSSLLFPVLFNVINAPFLGGATMAAVQAARGEPVSGKTGYRYLHRTGAFMATLCLVSFFSNLPAYAASLSTIVVLSQGHFLLLEMITLAVSLLIYTFLTLSIALVADQRKNPSQGIWGSIQRIKRCWLRVWCIFLLTSLSLPIITFPTMLGLVLGHSLVAMLGVVIFAIALIWLLPFWFLLNGVIYHTLVDEPQVH